MGKGEEINNAMPITVDWFNDEQTVLCFTYIGAWGWEEFYGSIQQSHKLMAHVNHTVHILIDVQDSQLFPTNMLSHLHQLRSIAHPNTGDVVVVGANSFLRTLSELYVRGFGHVGRRFKLVKTLKEAEQFLNVDQVVGRSNCGFNH